MEIYINYKYCKYNNYNEEQKKIYIMERELNKKFYYNPTYTFKEKPSIKNNKIGKINKKIR